MKGRTIRIYLVEGTPSGLLTAEIINWTGKVLVASRTQLPELAKREEVKRSGVYILTGEDPNHISRDQVYIGETDNVFSRLSQHNTDERMDFWTRTIIIISKDENLTKSHVRYLESRLIQLTSSARRAALVNNTSPEIRLPESDIADMDYFLDQIQILLPTLGFTFALPPPAQIIQKVASSPGGTKSEDISPIFVLIYGGTYAEAREIEGEFVVLRDSTVRKINTPSLGITYVGIRKQLVDEGRLVNSNNEDFFVLTEDISLSSPSAAAAVVTGTKLNGRTVWQVKETDMTYADWVESQIQVPILASDGSKLESESIV